NPNPIPCPHYVVIVPAQATTLRVVDGRPTLGQHLVGEQASCLQAVPLWAWLWASVTPCGLAAGGRCPYGLVAGERRPLRPGHGQAPPLAGCSRVVAPIGAMGTTGHPYRCLAVAGCPLSSLHSL
ncbi:hypothetical protein BHM03_00054700, partial [Ensete ventricosum]